LEDTPLPRGVVVLPRENSERKELLELAFFPLNCRPVEGAVYILDETVPQYALGLAHQVAEAFLLPVDLLLGAHELLRAFVRRLALFVDPLVTPWSFPHDLIPHNKNIAVTPDSAHRTVNRQP
jgi:hypothetical protein